MRCKLLREVDPHHDVYVGPVGMWMPWDPEAYKTGRVEYLEDELNQSCMEKLMNLKLNKNFDKRVPEAKELAIEKNRNWLLKLVTNLLRRFTKMANSYSADSSGAK